MPHRIDRTDLDLQTLGDDLSRRLGRPVSLLVAPPQTVVEDVFEDVMYDHPVAVREEDGTVTVTSEPRVAYRQRVGTRTVQVEGRLQVHPVNGGDELKVDGRIVLEAVRAHTPPPRPRTTTRQSVLEAAEQKAADGDTAGALADVLAILRAS